MKRLALAITAMALLCGLTGGSRAGGRFDSKLSKDQQILQVLNRLTFGRVRATSKKSPRGHGQMGGSAAASGPHSRKSGSGGKAETAGNAEDDSDEIMAAYPQVPPALMFRQTPLNELLPQDQIRRVYERDA